MKTDFEKFAGASSGISSLALSQYIGAVNSYLNPSIIEERKLNVAAMDVFSRLMMDRIIWLGVQIDNDVANILQAQLLYLESTDPTAEISMYINTPGGSVSAGLGIYDTMQLISPDVATICTGMAASMGSILLCAGAKGKRAALPHSRVMIHQPLGGAQGQATEIEIHAREILRIRQEMNEVLAKHTGQSVEKIAADTERDHYLTSKEAKEYGLIDEVVSRSKSAE